MTFKPEYLEKIGINPNSVPQNLSAQFIDVTHKIVEITCATEKPVYIDTKKDRNDSINETVANTLVRFGASKLAP